MPARSEAEILTAARLDYQTGAPGDVERIEVQPEVIRRDPWQGGYWVAAAVWVDDRRFDEEPAAHGTYAIETRAFGRTKITRHAARSCAEALRMARAEVGMDQSVKEVPR